MNALEMGFTAIRENRVPTVVFDEVRNLVESGERLPSTIIRSRRRRRIMIASTLVGVGIVLGAAYLALVEPGREMGQRDARGGAAARPVEPSATEGAHAVTPDGSVDVKPDDVPPTHGSRVRASGATDAAAADPEATEEGGPRAIEFSPSRLIELSTEALARLGIRADTAGVWMPISGRLLQVSMHGTILDASAPTAPADVVAPVLVTDDLGRYRLLRYDEEEIDPVLAAKSKVVEQGSPEWLETQRALSVKADAWLAGIAGRLIPILVRTGRVFTSEDSAANRWRPDCIIWFEPVDPVLSVLPAEIRSGIESELATAARMATRDGGVTLGREPVVTGEPYLDILRASSGAVESSSLNPNPATDRSSIRFHLSAARRVAVRIRDIHGRIRSTVVEQALPAGDHTFELDLAGIPPGLHVITIEGDGGECAVQRLIRVE